MWKTIAPLLMGLSLFFAVPVLTAQEAPKANDGSIKKTVLVEIEGKLERIEVLDPDWDWCGTPPERPRPLIARIKHVWQITADGKTYELEFSSRSIRYLAEKLNGQTVVLSGRLEERFRSVRVGAGSEGSKEPVYMHVPYQVVVVTGLKAVESDYVKQTIQVEVRGKLSWYDPFLRLLSTGIHSFQVWTVTANGTSYDLDFGDNKELAEKVQKLDGKTVIVTGTLETQLVEAPLRRWYLPENRHRELVAKHIIHVTDLKVVAAK